MHELTEKISKYSSCFDEAYLKWCNNIIQEWLEEKAGEMKIEFAHFYTEKVDEVLGIEETKCS